jgi:hypothetical protein
MLKRTVLPSLWFVILAAQIVFSQTVTGSIVGTVTDPDGALIAGAKITLTSETTRAVREIKTDRDGNFTFSAVVPGTYTITVEQTGFKRFDRTGIDLLPNDHLSVGPIRLEVGAMTESVRVTAEGAMIQTASSERSGVVTSEQVRNLTIVSRDFSVLASLQPGVVYNGAAETQSFSQSARYNVNGGRTTQNNITVDGIPIENSNVGSTNTFVSLDAISEVKVLTSNFQAEFGRKPAGAIQAVTKAGTDSYHGGAYWDQRNEAFNSKPYNNDIIKTQNTAYRFITAGATLGGPIYIPKLIKRDEKRLFFFFLYEGQREVRPQDTRFVTVPTALERAGDFSKSLSATSPLLKIIDPANGKQFSNNMIPVQRINSVGQAFLNQFPLPNAAADPIKLFNGKTYNYVIQESLHVPKNAQTLRVDYNITPNTSVHGVFNRWYDDERGFAVPAGNSNWGWLPSEYNPIARTFTVSATHIFSPTLIMESSFGFSRWTEGNNPTQALLDLRNRSVQKLPIPQLFPDNNPLNIMPQANFGGIDNPANPSIASRYPISGTEDVYLGTTSFTKVRGRHTMKAGTYFEHWNQIKAPNGNFTGTYDFSGSNQTSAYTAALGNTTDAFANALLGNFFSYTESTTRPPTQGRYNGVEWYAQDSFKVSRNLTLDLGIRFGWSQPFHTPDLKESGFNPAFFDPAQRVSLYTAATAPVKTALGAIVPGSGNPLNGTVDRVLDPSYPQGLRTTGGVKPAPRFGFAYDPFGRGNTAIRGGFGMFYDVRERDNFYVNTFKNPPLQQNPIIYFSNFSTLGTAAGYTFPASTSGFQKDRQIPYVMDFSLSIQQNIGLNTVVDIGYVGNLGRHLLWMKNLNAIPPGTVNPYTTSLPSQFYRPYIGYLDILESEYQGTSNYNALQVSANRRFSRGVVFGAAYTWSKALGFADDETQQVINLPGYTPRSFNYGKLGFDHTHIFKGSWSWDTPRVSRVWDNRFARGVLDDWKLSGIMTYQTGAPLGITIGTITANNPLTNKVQNFTATQWSGSPTEGSRVSLISNTGGRNIVVALPAQGTLGSAPKYVFAGPGINNWDMALSKQIALPGERFRLLFNVHAYNTFNHPQFTGVDQTANFNVDASGAVTQTNKNFLKNNVAGAMRRLQLGLRLSF